MASKCFIRRWLSQSFSIYPQSPKCIPVVIMPSYRSQTPESQYSQSTSSSTLIVSQNPVKRWCITLNNYTDEEYDLFKLYIQNNAEYGIVGREIGDSRTPHLQCFICLKKKLRLTTLRYTLSGRAHYEPARGNVEQNITYCKKEKDFWEHGEPPKYGRGAKRTINDAATAFIETIEGSTSLRDYMNEHPVSWLLHGRTFLSNYMLTSTEIHRPNTYAIWIYGPTGIGKSYFAHQIFPNAYIKSSTIKWWHRYRLQKQVIIDEMNSPTVELGYWLTWLDKYPVTVETKGADIPLHADEFIITSNFPPSQVFNDTAMALNRRLKVFHITERQQFSEVEEYINLQQSLRDIEKIKEIVTQPQQH